MRRLKIGRLHLSGPQAWPDNVLDYSTATLFAGAALQLKGFVLGVELHAKRHWNPWAAIYLGLWAFEIYFDTDRSFGAPE